MKWSSILVQIISMISGGIGGALRQVDNLVKSGFKTAVSFHQEGIAFARELGMSAKEAQAYTEVLTDRTEKLAMKYGVAAEQVRELQRNISVATNRQLMLNDSQSEQFLQLNKLVGSNTVSKFTEEIMNGMGGQLSTVTGAVSKAYATAAKSGLNAQKVSEKIANNLNMANRLSFRNGVDGLTRMAMQAEKMGMNLQSVESAANKFMELDKAIEGSARMQMLGGSAAAMFGNPLTAAYEANYDPEAFAKRMQDSLASYATFDAQKGVANVNGINKDFVKAIADAMGISHEEATRMAKKQSEVRYKESHISSAYDNLTPEQRDFLINKSNVANGRVKFTTSKGEEVDLSSGQSIDPEVLAEMMKYEGMSDRDIMEQNAQTLTSINEQLSGVGASISAMFAKELNNFLPGLTQDIKDIGAWAKTELQPIAHSVGEAVGTTIETIKGYKDEIKSIASFLTGALAGFIKFAANHWELTLGAIIALKIGKGIMGIGLGGGETVGSRVASRAGKGAWSGLKGLFGNLWGASKGMTDARYHYNANRFYGGGRISSAIRAPFQAFRGLTGAQKFAVGGTAALGVGISAAQGIMAQSAYKDQLEAINRGEWDREKYRTKEEAVAGAQTERNSAMGGAIGEGIGTVIGTALGGPVGAMIGGAIGKFAGEYIGKNWAKITDWMAKGWNKFIDGMVAVGSWIKDKWKGFKSVNWASVGEKLITSFLPSAGAIIQVVKHWDVVKEWLKEKWEGAIASVKEGCNSIKEGWDKYVVQPFDKYIVNPFNEYIIQPINDYIIKPAKKIWENIQEGWNKLLAGIQKFLDDPWGTTKEAAKGVYEDAKAKAKDTWEGVKGWFKEKFGIEHSEGGFINDGARGVEHPVLAQKDEVILNPAQQRNFMALANGETTAKASESHALVQKSEVILNPTQQKNFMALANDSTVRAKEYGGVKEYVYQPSRSETSNVNGNTITVKDFNINLSGTLKLDAGNVTKNIDMYALLNDVSFMNALKDMIKTSINNDMNGGRYMNDLATMRGQISSSSLIGK